MVEALTKAWGSAIMVTRGQIYDVTMLPGLVAHEEGTPVGLLMYHIADQTCEIVTLNSWRERAGIATRLIEATGAAARAAQCHRLWVITTNDNLIAQQFYQRRGFTLCATYPNAMEMTRMFKPEIPLVGQNGIAITDELEFEMAL